VRVSVGRVAMTLKATRVTWLKRTALPQGSQGPDGARPPAPPPRLVKTQCSCSSGFSIERRPWIDSSVKYDCSLVTRGADRFLTKIFKRITTWKRSSSLFGLEGMVRMLWFQAPFEKIDMHRGGVKPASTDTEAMHTAEGQQQPHLRQWSCS